MLTYRIPNCWINSFNSICYTWRTSSISLPSHWWPSASYNLEDTYKRHRGSRFRKSWPRIFISKSLPFSCFLIYFNVVNCKNNLIWRLPSNNRLFIRKPRLIHIHRPVFKSLRKLDFIIAKLALHQTSFIELEDLSERVLFRNKSLLNVNSHERSSTLIGR